MVKKKAKKRRRKKYRIKRPFEPTDQDYLDAICCFIEFMEILEDRISRPILRGRRWKKPKHLRLKKLKKMIDKELDRRDEEGFDPPDDWDLIEECKNTPGFVDWLRECVESTKQIDPPE